MDWNPLSGFILQAAARMGHGTCLTLNDHLKEQVGDWIEKFPKKETNILISWKKISKVSWKAALCLVPQEGEVETSWKIAHEHISITTIFRE